MRALDPEVVDAVYTAIEPLLPVPDDDHPLGCHNPRISDRVCFEGILTRLVVGCSWETAEQLIRHAASDTTLRARNNEWVAAGIFDALADEAIAAYDRIIELDLSECSIDGSQHKAPCGGPGTGPNPTDRGRSGWKWSLLADRNGIPIGWATDGANSPASTARASDGTDTTGADVNTTSTSARHNARAGSSTRTTTSGSGRHPTGRRNAS